jgi:hypothetical protein
VELSEMKTPVYLNEKVSRIWKVKRDKFGKGFAVKPYGSSTWQVFHPGSQEVGHVFDNGICIANSPLNTNVIKAKPLLGKK